MSTADYQATTLLAMVAVAGVACVALASLIERIVGWLIEPEDAED